MRFPSSSATRRRCRERNTKPSTVCGPKGGVPHRLKPACYPPPSCVLSCVSVQWHASHQFPPPQSGQRTTSSETFACLARHSPKGSHAQETKNEGRERLAQQRRPSTSLGRETCARRPKCQKGNHACVASCARAYGVHSLCRGAITKKALFELRGWELRVWELRVRRTDAVSAALNNTRAARHRQHQQGRRFVSAWSLPLR